MSNPYAEIGPCEYWPHGEREEQPGRDDRSREAEPCDFFVVNKAGTGARVGCVRTGELLVTSTRARAGPTRIKACWCLAFWRLFGVIRRTV